MKKILLGLALATGVAGAAAAAPIVPIGYLDQYQPGTVAADRSDPNAMFDGDLNTFYSLGLGGSIVLDFGRLVAAPGTIAEVTFKLAGYIERVQIFVGLTNDAGAYTHVATVVNSSSQGGTTVNFSSAPFQFVKLVDASDVKYGRDGFDVAEISFSPVPVPAAGLLLGGALFGLGALRRRRATKA